MKYQPGYAYHIKDSYFAKVQDSNLMQNKEAGNYRPTYFCLQDKKTGLLWVVPMSTKIEKFQAIHDKQKARYGKCLTIVMGEYGGKKSAFLLQNMFPITEQYIDHIHTVKGNPVPVKYSIQQVVQSNMAQLRLLINKGSKIVFSDVQRLEKLMIAEIAFEQKADPAQAAPATGKTPKNMKDRMAAAADEAKKRNAGTQPAPKRPKDLEK